MNFYDGWENVLTVNALNDAFTNATPSELDALDTTASEDYDEFIGDFDVLNRSYGIPSESETDRNTKLATQITNKQLYMANLPKLWDAWYQTKTSAANRTIDVVAAGNDKGLDPSVGRASWPYRYANTRGQILTVVACRHIRNTGVVLEPMRFGPPCWLG